MANFPQMLFKSPNSKAIAMSATDVTTLQGLGFSTSVPGGWVDNPGTEAAFASPSSRQTFVTGGNGAGSSSDMEGGAPVTPNTSDFNHG